MNFPPIAKTVVLLILSNCFMTAAWYGHLKLKNVGLIAAVFIGWGLAFFEYSLQVPANRIGYENGISGYKLKIIQECITLVIFMIFAWLVLGETPQWKHLASFALILAAAMLTFSSVGG
jgi:uncharacterized protein (DUF486 family)